MNMKKDLNRPCRLAWIAVVAAFLPIAASHAAGAKSAEAAWQSLTNFSLSPPPMSWSTNPPTQPEIDKFDDQRAKESASMADQAHAFYTHYPKDTNSLEAQVLEVSALQRAVHLGLTNQQALLIQREQSLAQNTNAPMEIRYQLRLDLIGREVKSRIDAGAPPLVELEKAGRALVKEFPSGPAGFELLSQVAESADLIKMQELGKVMADSGGPFAEMGQGLLRRLAVVGKPLPITFKTDDGRDVNTQTLSNKVVLVDFWATWCPHCVEAVPRIKKLYEQYHTNGFEVVGINFDEPTGVAQRFIQEQSMTWPEFFGGRDNQYAHDYAINFLPSAWLVDRKGIVQDIHGTIDMEAKIDKLMAR